MWLCSCTGLSLIQAPTPPQARKTPSSINRTQGTVTGSRENTKQHRDCESCSLTYFLFTRSCILRWYYCWLLTLFCVLVVAAGQPAHQPRVEQTLPPAIKDINRKPGYAYVPLTSNTSTVTSVEITFRIYYADSCSRFVCIYELGSSK